MELREGASVNISGSVDRVLFYSDSTKWFAAILCTDEGQVKITGSATTRPAIKAFWNIKGKVEQNKYGLQVKASSIVESFPEDRTSVVYFLKEIDGISDVLARRIADKLGANALNKIVENHEVLVGISGIGKERAESIREYVVSRGMGNDVEAALASMEIGAKTRKLAVETFGIETIKNWIEENPWMLVRVPRISFPKVDKWAMGTGKYDANDPRRAAAVISATIEKSAQWGHTVEDEDAILVKAKSLRLAVPITEDAIDAGLVEGIKNGTLKRVEEGKVCLSYLAAAEENIARILTNWLKNDFEQGSIRNIEPELYEMLTKEQKHAVANAINHRVSGLTGGPGTGKSLTSGAILKAFYGTSVQIVAPTGKAARRAQEITGIEASTIHRFIGRTNNKLKSGKNDSDETITPEDVIPSVILVDECSMVDVVLFSQLLRVLERRSRCRIVIVGDVDQLPSIQPGRLLGDIIESGIVPFTRLTEVKRQGEGSNIIVNAARINNGNPEIQTGTDFVAYFDRDPERIQEGIVSYLSETLVNEGIDPINDVQVMSGQRTTALGTEILNSLIRMTFNPEHPSKKELLDRDDFARFRVGDKVMVTENNYDLNVVNGDQGIVRDILLGERIDQKAVIVEINDALVTFKGDDINSLVQSWAVTCHKMQGSEVKVALVVCHEETGWALQRALLYTGITRGKERVVIFGTQTAVNKAVGNPTLLRYTRLMNLLTGQQ